MKTSGFWCKRLGAIALMITIPLVIAVPAPRSGEFETGFVAGLSGAAASLDLGVASAGGFDFSVGLDAGNPWFALAPSAEFTIGASVAPWRSAIRIESSLIAGVAKISGVHLAAPYGGLALGLDFPLGRSGFAIRVETLARLGGREYAVSATNTAGTVRYIDSWAPALVDVQVGICWKPIK